MDESRFLPRKLSMFLQSRRSFRFVRSYVSDLGQGVSCGTAFVVGDRVIFFCVVCVCLFVVCCVCVCYEDSLFTKEEEL